MPEIKTVTKSSLKNNIFIGFFIIIITWGISITNIFQHILYKVLFQAGLDQSIIAHISKHFITLSTGFTLAGGLVVLLISDIFSKIITQPIHQLRDAVLKVAEGNLEVKIDITSQDEFGELGNSFNNMTEELQKRTVSINYVDNIIQSMLDMLIVIDPHAKIKTVNKAMCDLLGYEEQELIDKPVSMIFEEGNFCQGVDDLLNKLSEGILLIGDDFKVVKVNNAFMKMTGLKEEDIIGKFCHQVIRNLDSRCQSPGDICPMLEMKKDGSSTIKQYAQCDAKVNQIGVNVTAAPIFDGKNNPIYYLYFARKIEGGQVSSIQQGQLLSDVNGIKNDLAKCVRILQQKRLFSELGISQLIEKGRITEVELQVRSKFQKKIPVSFSGSVMYDAQGKIIGIVGIARDMREIKRLMQKEKELAASSQQKAEELEAAYSELKNTQQQLLQAGKMAAVGQLAGGVAHEINNPMAVILGFSQIILKSIDKEHPLYIPAEQIEREATRCKNLVRDLLVFSRTPNKSVEKISLNAVVEEATRFAEHQTKLANIVIERNLGPDVLCSADKNGLEQVIINLIVNAKDAMPEGGTIRVSSWSDKINVYFSIEDNGCGISKDNLDVIFEPFFTTKEVGKGTGLGLSLIYEIVKKHNGEIEVESKVGKGTCFTVIIPNILKTSDASPAKKVLIIDDDIVVIKNIEELFKKIKPAVEIYSANDGYDGMLKVQEINPDIITMDIQMPKMDGIQATKQIRKRFHEKKIKILFITAFPDDLNESIIQDLDISGVISKPIRVETVTEKIVNLLNT